MQIITVLSEAMDQARRKMKYGEQAMLIDIFSATALTPGILGQHLTAEVEDSFALYSGEYEKKWGVDREEMETKIRALPPLDAALMELWAMSVWGVADGDLEAYLRGKKTLAKTLEDLAAELKTQAGALEQTRSAFKSAAVAEVRGTLEGLARKLEGLL